MTLHYKKVVPNKDNDSLKKHYLIELKEHLDLTYQFRRNTLTLEIEAKLEGKKKHVPLDEALVNTIWVDIQVAGFKCSYNTLLKLLNSDHTPDYNPLKEYFENLPPHDGRDYIGKLANTIKIRPIESNGVCLVDIWKPFFTKWLMAAAANIIGKGINQTCLILVGEQGTGKTSWLNKLCPPNLSEYLVCSHINPTLTDQNTANFLAEKFLVNIDDQLETIFGKDFNSMKAIITAPSVTNRKTWHRLTKKRDRICSFMGSVNNAQFLTDGQNRRYLVFTVDQIDYLHDINMNKVWAQVLDLVQKNTPYWFNTEEIIKLNQVNEIYRQIPPEEEWLIRLFEPCKPEDPKAQFLMPSEMLSLLKAHSGLQLSAIRLSRAIQKLDYHKKISKRINGQPRNVYPVIQRSELDEHELQDKLRTHNKK